MTIRIVRLGTERGLNEGLRIGTVRRPPRGVKKEDFARKNYYDLWFPNLAPSANLLKKHFPIDSERTWSAFKRGFLREMTATTTARELDLLAALSKHADFSIGCYCEDEKYCHRSLLREILKARGATISS